MVSWTFTVKDEDTNAWVQAIVAWQILNTELLRHDGRDSELALTGIATEWLHEHRGAAEAIGTEGLNASKNAATLRGLREDGLS